MASPSTAGKAAVARQAWSNFFDFLRLTVGYREGALRRLKLTPNDARALEGLDLDTGRPMGELADEWATDASNATWIVDRLEAKGWVKRRLVADDRRVKQVVLTPLGLKTRDELRRLMYRPPPELLALDKKALVQLRDALAQLRPRTAHRKGR